MAERSRRPVARTEYWQANRERPAVEIVRSTRRTKTVFGSLTPEGRVRLLVPVHSTKADIEDYLGHL